MAKKPAASRKSSSAKAARPAKSAKKRPTARKSGVKKAGPAKNGRAPYARAAKSPTRRAAKAARSAKLRNSVDGCVSTLNDWRKECVARLSKMIRGTSEKIRHIKLSSLKEAGKQELQELVRLATRLNEARGPRRKKTVKAK